MMLFIKLSENPLTMIRPPEFRKLLHSLEKYAKDTGFIFSKSVTKTVMDEIGFENNK